MPFKTPHPSPFPDTATSRWPYQAQQKPPPVHRHYNASNIVVSQWGNPYESTLPQYATGSRAIGKRVIKKITADGEQSDSDDDEQEKLTENMVPKGLEQFLVPAEEKPAESTKAEEEDQKNGKVEEKLEESKNARAAGEQVVLTGEENNDGDAAIAATSEVNIIDAKDSEDVAEDFHAIPAATEEVVQPKTDEEPKASAETGSPPKGSVEVEIPVPPTEPEHTAKPKLQLPSAVEEDKAVSFTPETKRGSASSSKKDRKKAHPSSKYKNKTRIVHRKDIEVVLPEAPEPPGATAEVPAIIAEVLAEATPIQVHDSVTEEATTPPRKPSEPVSAAERIEESEKAGAEEVSTIKVAEMEQEVLVVREEDLEGEDYVIVDEGKKGKKKKLEEVIVEEIAEEASHDEPIVTHGEKKEEKEKTEVADGKKEDTEPDKETTDEAHGGDAPEDLAKAVALEALSAQLEKEAAVPLALDPKVEHDSNDGVNKGGEEPLSGELQSDTSEQEAVSNNGQEPDAVSPGDQEPGEVNDSTSENTKLPPDLEPMKTTESTESESVPEAPIIDTIVEPLIILDQAVSEAIAEEVLVEESPPMAPSVQNMAESDATEKAEPREAVAEDFPDDEKMPDALPETTESMVPPLPPPPPPPPCSTKSDERRHGSSRHRRDSHGAAGWTRPSRKRRDSDMSTKERPRSSRKDGSSRQEALAEEPKERSQRNYRRKSHASGIKPAETVRRGSEKAFIVEDGREKERKRHRRSDEETSRHEDRSRSSKADDTKHDPEGSGKSSGSSRRRRHHRSYDSESRDDNSRRAHRSRRGNEVIIESTGGSFFGLLKRAFTG